MEILLKKTKKGNENEKRINIKCPSKFDTYMDKHKKVKRLEMERKAIILKALGADHDR
jgi:hypothetical protein